MSQKGISFRLNAHITTIAIIIIASIVYVNYYFGSKILISKIEEGAINQSNLVISKISRITVGTEEIANNVSHQALYFNQHNDLIFLLQKVLESNQIIESIHVELLDAKSGKLMKFSSNKPGQLICLSDSLINNLNDFQKLKSGNSSRQIGEWSNPYYCKYDTSHLIVSYKSPIYIPDSEIIAGAVTCVVSLKMMRQMLSEIKIGEEGYAFIIDRSGTFLTHPKSEWILTKNLLEKASPIFDGNIKTIETAIRNGGRGAGHGISEYLQNQKSWFYFAPLENSVWSVIIVIPEKELFREIDVIFKIILWGSILGILILFFVNMFVFKRLLEPLARVTDAIQRFSSVPGKERKSKNEIKMLAESLEDWQAKYGLLINERNKTAREKLKFEKDIKMAREIQQNIFPSGYPAFPEYPEIDLYAAIKPAESIGGDLYDYFFIDRQHLLIAIGDVSGKGIPASLFMAIASTLIKNKAKVLSSKEIITRVNRELSDRNANQYFLTLFLGVLDLTTGIMDYCNAAHNFPYILNPDGSIHALSKSHGLPLGIYANKTYRSSSVQLSFGDVIIFYTDGVINSRDSSGIHYGIEKLENNILSLIDLNAQEVVSNLLTNISIYEGENRQSDDITLMALKFLRETKNQA